MARDGRARQRDPNLVAFGLRVGNLCEALSATLENEADPSLWPRFRASSTEARHLSQEQLAHEAGLCRTVIGFIERGDREVGLSKVWPLAEALGVSASDLFSPT